MKRSFIREILESIDSETISFAGGLPNEELFPLKELQSASQKIFKNSKVLQYSISNGITPLREKIAKFYSNDGFKTDLDNILITSGSQQALYIISKYFENRQILIEEPSYLGAINIFKMNNLNMRTVPLKYDGVEIESFKKSYSKIKLAYLIPDFQNPMASLYSKERREEIAKIVEESKGYLIEDAPYSELYFDKKEKSISSIIPNKSLHLGSFSKTLSPSLRIGWIRANKDLIKLLTVIKEIIDLHSCGISQYILNEYLKDEVKFQKHLQNLRLAYRDKMEIFATILNEKLPNFTFQKPKGGMFIYGKLKDIDTFDLVQKSMKEKVVFVPANQFYLDNKIRDEIRFNFTNSTKKQIEIGIEKIGEVLKKL